MDILHAVVAHDISVSFQIEHSTSKYVVYVTPCVYMYAAVCLVAKGSAPTALRIVDHGVDGLKRLRLTTKLFN